MEVNQASQGTQSIANVTDYNVTDYDFGIDAAKNYIDAGTTITLGNINGTHTTTTMNPDSWLSDELKFNIDGENISFKGQELIRLREMLSDYIRENHPEDLL